ncbi:MAG: Phosphatidylethanolamine N-methyltransferase [Candidatus Woesebacteria bacterium GW2011_GWB1_45_5]|uniref:Phosphatidylethanolamine N-methyltransferase n=1 Tax=Candidatus Woesebacteria bacterium GW2011_GWB1_45_5 TaxID=1618581 RepID=A0A0G1MPC0_9BACT|nr:MAG: Phosphatidylethanolamine N-methyltransferase [Candidatus Woesebacteria bacterium GW2011_GWB1_45_5]
MSAAYDTFDYPAYWIGREYEHKSEVFALKQFLSKIRKVKTILDIGTGFGRLVPFYSFRAKKIILSDPSSKLLKLARETFKSKKNLKFIHSSLENLPLRVPKNSIDLIIMIRVIHHIRDIETAFGIFGNLLKARGYLIVEFANKRHLKATLRHFLQGDLTFPIDPTTTDIQSRKTTVKSLPFLNYHPDKIDEIMDEYGFDVVEKRSVSNIRSTLLKKIFPVDFLVYVDMLTQKVLSYINFGPSIFVMARKR